LWINLFFQFNFNKNVLFFWAKFGNSHKLKYCRH
jgi:hypothetical protein